MASSAATTTRRNMLLRPRLYTSCPSDDRQHPPDRPAGLPDPGGRERRHAIETEFEGPPNTGRTHPTGDRNAHAWVIENARGKRRTLVRKERADETRAEINQTYNGTADREVVRFDYMQAKATRTASQTMAERQGVCRDFAHLAISLCRCMNIPARYCTGYLSDIGESLPHPAGDFAARMEVCLAGEWQMFDPRNNKPRFARILIARGRDAADVPLTQTFEESTLTEFKVWTDELA